MTLFNIFTSLKFNATCVWQLSAFRTELERLHQELSGTKSSLSAELKALQAHDSHQQQQLETLRQELAHAPQQQQQQQPGAADKTANLQQLRDEALQEVNALF
jgi:chromosome segregation ATPase